MIQYNSSVFPDFGTGLVISIMGGAGTEDNFVGSNRGVLVARSLSRAEIPSLKFADGSCKSRRVVRSFLRTRG